MENEQGRPAWMEDELVRDIPREKLDFLSRMFEEANRQKNKGSGERSQKEMLLRVMPLLKQMKSSDLQLTPQEMQVAIAAIKKHSTAGELSEIERILGQNK